MITKERIKRTWLYKLYFNLTHLEQLRRKKKANALFKKEGNHVLSLFAEALNKENILFWLEFGTLLGFYREKGFIAHDDDLDTGVFIEDRDRVRASLEKNGFKRVSYYRLPEVGVIEDCYQHQTMKTCIDVFYFIKDGDLMYSHILGPTKSLDEIINSKEESVFSVYRAYFPQCNFVKTTFNDISVYVPNDIPRHLSYHYGDNFMTPIPNFSFNDRKHIKSYTLDECKAYGRVLKEKFDL